MGTDLSVVRAARVSDAKLISYLLRNKHTSPFESVTFTFEVKAPIFVLRQWHRHRTWSYNEVSARYAELSEEFYIPEVEHIGMQASGNKQMRTVKQHQDALLFKDVMYKTNLAAFKAYKNMLTLGCPRELARTVLPVATYSHMFATVNLHNLFHFLRLRIHEHAQYEIRVYAVAILELIEQIVPVSVKAWKESA
jgi:thymidylate synthase (FAD)